MAVFSAPLGAQEFTYEYEDLPIPPASEAWGINAEGTVVGTTFSFGPPMAFVIEDGIPTFFTFPNAPVALGRDVNGDGVVIGDYSASGSPMDSRVFLRDEAGIFTSYQHPSPTALATFSGGLNDRGDFVGYYLDSADLELHGYVRYADGTWAAVEPPNAVGESIAVDINNRRVIHGVYNDPNLGVATQAFTLRRGTYRDLIVPGAASSSIFHVSDRAQCINYHPTDLAWFASGNLAAVLERGVYTEIAYPGAHDTKVLGINPRGDVVGSWRADPLSPPIAFVARRMASKVGATSVATSVP